MDKRLSSTEARSARRALNTLPAGQFVNALSSAGQAATSAANRRDPNPARTQRRQAAATQTRRYQNILGDTRLRGRSGDMR